MPVAFWLTFLHAPWKPPPFLLINRKCETLCKPDKQVTSLGDQFSSQRKTEWDKLRTEHS